MKYRVSEITDPRHWNPKMQRQLAQHVLAVLRNARHYRAAVGGVDGQDPALVRRALAESDTTLLAACGQLECWFEEDLDGVETPPRGLT